MSNLQRWSSLSLSVRLRLRSCWRSSHRDGSFFMFVISLDALSLAFFGRMVRFRLFGSQCAGHCKALGFWASTKSVSSRSMMLLDAWLCMMRLNRRESISETLSFINMVTCQITGSLRLRTHLEPSNVQW